LRLVLKNFTMKKSRREMALLVTEEGISMGTADAIIQAWRQKSKKGAFTVILGTVRLPAADV
jgi:hypothetical protein